MTAEKKFIKNLKISELDELFGSMGEKSFRGRQLMNWLFQKNVESFLEMTNFSKELRSLLDEQFLVSALEFVERQTSSIDGTEKYLFRTRDGHYIESVLIRNEGLEGGRLTVCLSSQVGCAMGCRFCETARLGLVRNLETAEILDQLCQVRRVSGLRNNNVVFMGMGEPFMNYDDVLKSADIMNYDYGMHISVRKITISTSGIRDAIERFIDEKRPYNLAISLNDSLPERRGGIMPVERRYPFSEIGAILDRKWPVSRNRLTIVYVMRDDNIAAADARRLKKLFGHHDIKLNLIPLNEGSHEFCPPHEDDVCSFVRELELLGLSVTLRKSFGSDILGACGQLSGKRYAAGCRQ